MRTFSNNYIPRSEVITLPGELHFEPIALSDAPALTRILNNTCSRSCDYTAGGILLWVQYFGYEQCIVDNTLFIKGLSEDISRRPSFAMPTGNIPLAESVDMIKHYCYMHRLDPLFTAVPEDRLDELLALGPAETTELTDWADYIYLASDLAGLCGKKYSKKRNHVHRFEADNPGCRLVPLDSESLPETIEFFENLGIESDKADPVMAEFEREQVLDVLRNFDDYPFEGAALRDGQNRIVAFTAGEVCGDTLVLHIEKMKHSVSGAGETINNYFARYMLSRHPGITYINREDDSGDPGLRFAKQSYHPAMMLRKYNVLLKENRRS